ncbi:MAG TPA: hypothetical protein PLM86_06885 [Bacteroidales bacterium]|nr:hypothetical protein [Bacteroidales bacterium]
MLLIPSCQWGITIPVNLAIFSGLITVYTGLGAPPKTSVHMGRTIAGEAFGSFLRIISRILQAKA